MVAALADAADAVVLLIWPVTPDHELTKKMACLRTCLFLWAQISKGTRLISSACRGRCDHGSGDK